VSRTAAPPAPDHSATTRAQAALAPSPSLILGLVLISFLAPAGATIADAAGAEPQSQATSPDQEGESAAKSEAADPRPFVEMRQNVRQRARQRRAARTDGDLPPAERKAQIVDNAWWNDQDLAERLQLSENQRHQMDDTLRQNLTTRREALDASRDAQGAFYEKLEAGDPKAAAAHLDAVDNAYAAVLHSQLELRIAVAEILTPDQRKTLAETRPRLWRQSWIHLAPRPAATARGRGTAKKQGDSGR